MARRALLPLALCAAFIASPALAFRHLEPGQDVAGLSVTQLGGENLPVGPSADGKATLVVFWATWSPRSAKALADCQELYGKYSAAGLRVIGVNVEQESPDRQEIARAVSLAKDAGVTYPVALDRELSLYARWGVVAVPSAVLVDASGKVVELLEGYAPGPSNRFLKRVQGALGVESLGRAPAGDDRGLSSASMARAVR